MPLWLAVASKWGSVLALIALVITFIKSLTAFIGFLTTAIQILIVLVFVAVFAGVGFLVYRGWQNSRKRSE